jgi:predicted nucleic acid-binding protein
MPSAVLDSTVLISAFLAQRGVSNELLRHARAGAFLLCLSEEILAEAQGVLLDEARRHRQRYHYPNEEAINFMVIATAQRGQAAYIVTRDKDLLSLQHHEGITMMTPEAFIAIVRERRRPSA